ncbi:ferrous iron transport protein B, partial [Enterococcus hirae]
VDVLLGRMADTPAPDGLLVVVDATHLYQGLYLLEQLLELQIPVVVALTMSDIATANGISLDLHKLQERLGGVHVVPVTA